LPRLENKTVLISGGASGIGAATARHVVQEGGRAVLADRDAAAGTILAAELGEQALFTPLEVTDEASWQAAVAASLEAFGALHGLLNAAGVGAPSNIETCSLGGKPNVAEDKIIAIQYQELSPFEGNPRGDLQIHTEWDYGSEKALLKAFAKVFLTESVWDFVPVPVGFNLYGFDLPSLLSRYDHHFGTSHANKSDQLLERRAVPPVRKRLQDILRSGILAAKKPNVCNPKGCESIPRFNLADVAERRSLFRARLIRPAAATRAKDDSDSPMLVQRPGQIRSCRTLVVGMRQHKQNVHLEPLVRLRQRFGLLRSARQHRSED